MIIKNLTITVGIVFMKLVFTHEDRLIVANARNILEGARISVLTKNEFAAGAIGELSAFDAWLELWVEDSDFEKAESLLATSISEANAKEWICPNCGESNDPSFETCWKCQRERI